MTDNLIEFVQYIKSKRGFYTVEDNLEETLDLSDRAWNILSAELQRDYLQIWGHEIPEELLKWEKIGGLSVDWELNLDNIYIYGGFYHVGLSAPLTFPPQPNYTSIACQHEYFTEEEERFLKKETNYFSRSAHGMGNGTYGIFHVTKDKQPFDILFLDRGRFFKTNFTLDTYYQSLIDSMGITGWQYFYLDFDEIKNVLADFKVGQRWLTIYPYGEGYAPSPLGHGVKKETSRLYAIVHHMEVCVYMLPKIFPDKDFSYHKQRLADFKAFLKS